MSDGLKLWIAQEAEKQAIKRAQQAESRVEDLENAIRAILEQWEGGDLASAVCAAGDLIPDTCANCGSRFSRDWSGECCKGERLFDSAEIEAGDADRAELRHSSPVDMLEESAQVFQLLREGRRGGEVMGMASTTLDKIRARFGDKFGRFGD